MGNLNLKRRIVLLIATWLDIYQLQINNFLCGKLIMVLQYCLNKLSHNIWPFATLWKHLENMYQKN
jgi:hypothetical protein